METSDPKIMDIESEVLVDSRTYERITSFLGIPFIIVFGWVWGKYESIFSIEYEGRSVVVIYPGICLVSKNDTLQITGNWYSGKKYKIKDDIIIANRIENKSAGLFFDLEK